MHSGAEVIVVTGCDHLQIERALESLPLRFAHNLSWTRGMGSSIAIGVIALGSQALGAFIIPGDMPFLTSALLKDLMAAFNESPGASIVYPTTLAGEQRNPVLWPRRFFPLLGSLSGSDIYIHPVERRIAEMEHRIHPGVELLFREPAPSQGQEERLAVLGATFEIVKRLRQDFVVEGLHALGGQRPFILRGATSRLDPLSCTWEFRLLR